MAATFDQAVAILNLDPDDMTGGDAIELQLYLDAANEWIATKVTDTSPAPVTLATLELLRSLWESQRGTDASPLAGDDPVPVNTLSAVITSRVLELIGPYMHKAVPLGLANFDQVPGWPDAVEWWLEPDIVGPR